MNQLPSSAELAAQIDRLKVQGYDLIAQRDFAQSQLNKTNSQISELMGLYQEAYTREQAGTPKDGQDSVAEG